MKKRMYLFIALFAGAHGLYAQDCATGYCPATITVHHKAGDVSPVGGDQTYNVVQVGTGTTATCWITSNLGCSTTPSAWSDYGTATNGWLWQVNRKQGFVFNYWTNAVPSTSITVTAGDTWASAQDPCTILLGVSWHIPATTEWNQLNTTWPYSGVKLNTASQAYMNGAQPTGWFNPGSSAGYAIQNYGYSAGTMLYQLSSGATSFQYGQGGGFFPVRCIKKVTD